VIPETRPTTPEFSPPVKGVRKSKRKGKAPERYSAAAASSAPASTEPEGAALDAAYLGSVQLFADAVIEGDPSSYSEAIYGQDGSNWLAAMNKEIASLEAMGTWETSPLPEGRKTVSCKWVYRVKRDADGTPTRYKARLVARGFSQVHGLDYDETYAPVTRLETIRLLLGVAAEKDWEIRQIDIKSAYLYGDLDEEIYMDAPPGYDVPEGHILHLRKALYSLKQAGRQWYKTLSASLKTFGLVQVTNDPHTFVAHRMVSGTRKTLILPVYVDDFIPMGDSVLVNDFETFLPGVFNVSSAGDASFFLGLWIQRDRTDKSLAIDQFTFVDTILARFNVPLTPSQETPLSTAESLVPNTSPVEDVIYEVRKDYQSKVGSLVYLMLGTRPDLAYSVGKLARFSSNPSPEHISLGTRGHLPGRQIVSFC